LYNKNVVVFECFKFLSMLAKHNEMSHCKM